MPDGRLGRATREDTGRRRFVCIWLMSARLLDAIMIRDRSAESRWLFRIEGGGSDMPVRNNGERHVATTTVVWISQWTEHYNSNK